jgi:hypothetical protein
VTRVAREKAATRPAVAAEIDGIAEACGLSREELVLTQLPEGFTIERAAGPPQVELPMFAAFDDRGRLFVAESSPARRARAAAAEAPASLPRRVRPESPAAKSRHRPRDRECRQAARCRD